MRVRLESTSLDSKGQPTFITSDMIMRGSFNGRTLDFQSKNVSSILTLRSKDDNSKINQTWTHNLTLNIIL